MKRQLITLLLILSINLILSESIIWKAEFIGDDDPAVKTSFEVSKGSFLRLYLTIIKKGQEYPPRASGRLLVPDSLKNDFILSNEVVVDTNESRQYSVFIGVSCQSKIEIKDHKLTFKIDSKDSDLIEWPELTIKLKNTPEIFKVQSIIEPINTDSFAPYIIESTSKFGKVQNVDILRIQFADIKGGTKGAGVIEDISIDPFDFDVRNIIELRGYYSGGKFESDTEFSATVITDNTCFKSKEEKFKWKVSNVNLPIIAQYDAKEIAEKAVENEGVGNIASFNLYITQYPLLISCGASASGDYTFLDQFNVVDQYSFVYKYQPDLVYYQTFASHEGKKEIHFSKANRFAQNFQTVCYLQTIRNKNGEKDFSDTLKITFGRLKEDDKKMIIKAEEPSPSQCGIWRFEEEMKKVLFADKVVEYCQNYFGGKEFAMHDIGCFICEERSPDFLTYNQKSICMRSSVNCPTTYERNLRDDFAGFLKTIDTKEKIEKELKITVSKVININHSSDRDEIDTSVIVTNVIEITKTEVVLLTISEVPQTLSCLIKDLNNKYFSTVTEDDFTKDTKAINLFPGQALEYEVKFNTAAGFDSELYIVVLMCYNLAQFQYHSYHTTPFITTTILKTDKQPLIDDYVPPDDCTRNNFTPYCLPYNYCSSGVDIKRYIPDLPDDLILFHNLQPGYKKLKIEDEIAELEKITDKAFFNEKIIFLGELLGKLVCKFQMDYNKCRQYKEEKIISFIDKVVNKYEKDLIIEIEFDTHAEKNVPILAYMLFALSDNADCFKDINVINKLSKFTHLVVEKFKDLTALISNKDIEAGKKEQSLKDFYSFLVLHHINMFEVYRFLEADKIIQKDTETQFLKAPQELKEIKRDFELLLTYMSEMGVPSFDYGDLFILHSRGAPSSSSNSDKVQFKFRNENKISIEPSELFDKYKGLKLIQMFYFNKHPFMSIINNEYHSHTVSLRLIGENNNKFDSEIIEPSPEIFFNMTGVNDKFKEGFIIDTDNMSFMSGSSKWKTLTENKATYSVLTINKVGDYTIGLSKTSHWLWLIIVCSVLAVAVIAGIAYLIWMVVKNKKSKVNIENINPLMTSD